MLSGLGKRRWHTRPSHHEHARPVACADADADADADAVARLARGGHAFGRIAPGLLLPQLVEVTWTRSLRTGAPPNRDGMGYCMATMATKRIGLRRRCK